MRLTKSHKHLIPFLLDLQEEERNMYVNAKRKILDMMSDDLLSNIQQQAFDERETTAQKTFYDALKIRRYKER